MEVQNLRAYLAQKGMTMKKFAQCIGCSSTYLSHIAAGRRTVGKRLARDIYYATEGIVDLPTAMPKNRK